MRRQKKFYAWGYADEDLTPEEIRAFEAESAERHGVSGFDITPPPKAEEITLRTPRVTVPDGLKEIVRTDHLTRLEHSYGKAGFDALLEALWAHATQPQFIYRHVWKLGDLVMWDNRSTMHRRDPFDGTARRIMHRTQIKGTTRPMAFAA